MGGTPLAGIRVIVITEISSVTPSGRRGCASLYNISLHDTIYRGVKIRIGASVSNDEISSKVFSWRVAFVAGSDDSDTP